MSWRTTLTVVHFKLVLLFVLSFGQKRGPTLTARERTIETTTGNTTELGCIAESILGGQAQTTEEVVWRVNGTAVQNSTDYVVYQSRGVLVLKKTVPQLQGTYTCELSTNSSVYDTINLSIREGCFPGAFRPFLAVGELVSVPCEEVHSEFSSHGNITWTCDSHMTWNVDVSQCTFVKKEDGEEREFTLFLYQVPLEEETISRAAIDQNFKAFVHSLVTNSSVTYTPESSISNTGRSGVLGLSYIAVEVSGGRNSEIVQRIASTGRFEISSLLLSVNVTAVREHAGLLSFMCVDSCPCPNIIHDIEKELENGINIAVSICSTAYPLQGACDCTDNGCLCGSLFMNDTGQPGSCIGDIDQDGVPDIADTCDNCCSGESRGGFSWNDAVEGSTGYSSCATLHSSFTSYSAATRKCVNHTWSPVDTSSCTFALDSSLSVVVLEGTVNGLHPSVENSGVKVALDEEISLLFANYNLQDHWILSFSSDNNPEVVVVLEFPQNVSEAVVTVYQDSTHSTIFTAPPAMYGHRPSDSCPCTSYSSGTAGLMLDTCMGSSKPPCQCEGTSSEANCQCVDPYVEVYAGGNPTDVICSLDSDGDGFADVADSCPEVYDRGNICKTSTVDSSTHCETEEDNEWFITWESTPVGFQDTQRCPGGLEEVNGLATRQCLEGGIWNTPVVLHCESIPITLAFEMLTDARANLEKRLKRLQSVHPLPLTRAQLVTLNASLDFLLNHSFPPTRYLLPSEVTTIISAVEIFTQFASSTTLFDEQYFNEDLLFFLIDDVLADSDKDQWEVVNQSFRRGAPLLLQCIETLSAVFRDSIHTNPNAITEEDGSVQNTFAYTGGAYILVLAESVSVEFDSSDLLSLIKNGNDTHSNLTASTRKAFSNESQIPAIDFGDGLLQDIGQAFALSTVEIVTTVVDNLPKFLPRATASGLDLRNYTVGSVLLSTQIARYSEVSDSIDDFSFNIDFPLEDLFEEEEESDVYCAFWNFSEHVDSTGLGGWSTEGVQKAGKGGSRASCSSTHLTTFAILVDTTGATTRINARERLALELVSYIGCAVSLACLLLAVLFFLCLRKELIQKVVYYVHFNLSIALICGLITFVSGIETAAWSVPACTIVATLLHYFFLAAFSWMLCEGIVLYNLLVKVFGANERKWIYIFTALGWGIPIPIVGVSVGVRWNYYRIPQSYNTSSSLYNVTKACWLSHEYGTIAAFIAPMLAIVVINFVFMVLSVRSIYKVKKNQMERTAEGITVKAAGTTLLKSTLILTPLLGFTWVIGLLAVNNYTTVFAWLFCFLNAFQGVFIFLFYVVRNDKVWSKLTRSSQKKKKGAQTASTFSARTSRSSLSYFSRGSRHGSTSSVYSNSLYKNKEASQHHDEKCTTIDEVDESINDISTTENGSVTFKVSPEV